MSSLFSHVRENSKVNVCPCGWRLAKLGEPKIGGLNRHRCARPRCGPGSFRSCASVGEGWEDHARTSLLRPPEISMEHFLAVIATASRELNASIYPRSAAARNLVQCGGRSGILRLLLPPPWCGGVTSRSQFPRAGKVPLWLRNFDNNWRSSLVRDTAQWVAETGRDPKSLCWPAILTRNGRAICCIRWRAARPLKAALAEKVEQEESAKKESARGSVRAGRQEGLRHEWQGVFGGSGSWRSGVAYCEGAAIAAGQSMWCFTMTWSRPKF